MTFAEFKAWLDGFSEGVGEAPTPEQWAKVREKLAQVYEMPVFTPPVILPMLAPTSPSIKPLWESPVTCGVSQTVAGSDKIQSWN